MASGLYNIAVGSLFVVSYEGLQPSQEFLDFLGRNQIGGVLLFADNVADRDQLREALKQIRSVYPPEVVPLVAIDQEGGRVVRLFGPPAQFRAAYEYGRDDDLAAYSSDYGAAMQYMSSLGINLNLAPVADLMLNEKNECMATRCFGSDPEKVAKFVAETVRRSHTHGLLCCLKHFPGLGAASLDPHHQVSEATYDHDTWRQRERYPFAKGLEAGADMVMTTHLHVPAIDSVIATGSEVFVKGLLRHELGFEGPIVTDCLLMHGAEGLGSVGERTVTALNVGHDLLLFGQQFERARRAFEAVVEAVERGMVSEERISAAQIRVQRMKLRVGALPA